MRIPKTKTVIVGTCAFAIACLATPFARSSPPSHQSLGPSTSIVQCPDGGTVTFIVPPPGFDPLTASNDELTANGLPPRPQDTADFEELRIWTTYVTSPIRYEPGCGDLKLPSVSRESGFKPASSRAGLNLLDDDPNERLNSSNYAGKSASKDHIAFDADSTIRTPGAACTSQTRRSTHWVGVGRIYNPNNVYPLVQAGIDVNCLSSGVNYNAFYEIYQDSLDWQRNGINLSVSSGNRIYVHVGISNSAHTVSFHMINASDGVDAGTYTPPVGGDGYGYYQSPYYTSGFAAWITEKFPTYDLTEFNPVAFMSNRLASGGGTWHNLYNESRVGYDLYGRVSPFRLLADYDSTTTGGSFNTRWHAAY